MERKYVIWGCGFRGKFLSSILKSKQIVAFIDRNRELVNTRYCGIDIIDFETYLREYKQYAIIISTLNPYEIEKFLQDEGVETYFLLLDCPGEFQGYGNFDYLRGIKDTFGKHDRVTIYGLNLFSILLYDYLEQKGIEKIALVPNKDMQKEKIQQFTALYPDINISSTNEGQGRILNTVSTEDDEYIRKLFGELVTIENYYDFSDKIKQYYNKAVKKFCNIHSGKRCFIVATGPSLRMDDLRTLKENGEICFSMNRIYCAFDETEWRPDYYVATDRVFIDDYWKDIINLGIKEKFISDRYIVFDHNKQKDLELYSNIHCLHIPARGSIQGEVRFSLDCAKQCYEGGTVVYTCLQLAAYMGFKEIYLLGTDCNYLGEKPTQNDYFIKDYLPVGGRTNAVQANAMLLAYKKAKKYANLYGFNIYNASRGGKLEVFERVDFDEIFI